METSPNEEMVNYYFDLIRNLRRGDSDAVEALMSLWHPEGCFEFAGAPPVVGSYTGHVAIKTLYKNRLSANGMPVTLELGGRMRETCMSIVSTDLTHLRSKDDQVIAGWRTTIGTEAGMGFDVAGSHMFSFADGKIFRLRVNVSPKPDESLNRELSMQDLSVQDIGRLSLAAWPVV